MPKHKNDDDTPPKGVLTKDGYWMASTLILDLLRPKGEGQAGYRKDAVTFIRDPGSGDIVESGTGKICKVAWLKNEQA